jgi:hypothetical protein
MRMTAFAIRMAIDTPIAINQLLHFDGLLGSQLARRGEDPLRLPLLEVEGVFCGSAALFETGPFGAVEHSVTRVKIIREQGQVLTNALAKQHVIGEMSPYRPQLREYTVFDSVKAVWFACNGDSAAVFDLVRNLLSIGAMATAGYGRIADRKLFKLPRVASPGFLLGNGLPARAVPINVWKTLELPIHPHALVSEQRYRPPYWESELTTCIAPSYYDLCGTFAEIRGMLGLE